MQKLDWRANGLEREPHGFVRDGGKALEPKDTMGADHIGDLFGEGCGVSDFGARDDEALEFVVAVFMGVMVVVIVIMMMVVIVGMIIFVVVVMHLIAGV